MHLDALLLHDGLLVDYSIEADVPCVIGFHYYYPSTKDSCVEGCVKPFYRTKEGWNGIEKSWYEEKSSKLHFCLDSEADFGFMPLQDPNSSSNLISLKTGKHHLLISYTSSNEDETSWQLFHPKGASYVCLEPLSALNPFNPVLKRNRLQMKLSFY
jgi:galactose mutarotase-like enzyme